MNCMQTIRRAEAAGRLFLAGLLIVAAIAGTALASPTDGIPAHFSHAQLQIETARGKRSFDVQVARSDAEQELGLMWVRILPVDQGMIFPMDPPRIASFWMKNTYIALDLLFLDKNGRIACIQPGVPLTLDVVTCAEPASGVLEIAGGQASAQRIKVGDRVIWASSP
jgi:uncharacterized membrane protein (UPF0127 family)